MAGDGDVPGLARHSRVLDMAKAQLERVGIGAVQHNRRHAETRDGQFRQRVPGASLLDCAFDEPDGGVDVDGDSVLREVVPSVSRADC